ncbi:hypothetical protein BDV29DRAFT_179086 [Aspergillus leporis]|uniref:Uncharacterized protein n=1 Tax=Aspergillus leporis TaxID=41062 RepID=A0A5N5WSH1_9EURO|nr:hypothetical protein BDV29DRAFT_179086 [Aspergillus leporis]
MTRVENRVIPRSIYIDQLEVLSPWIMLTDFVSATLLSLFVHSDHTSHKDCLIALSFSFKSPTKKQRIEQN